MRKNRLIVLMSLDDLRDFQANEAPDTARLRQFLSQYTYIDYTTDDWLEKLLYALPLRGMCQRLPAYRQQHANDSNDAMMLQ